jgi:hypothetical protein
MRRIALVLGLLLLIPNVQAQPTADSLETLFSSSRRSTPLAFGMSAVVPGLGQAYNRHWIKAAVGVAGEATVLLLYASWRQQGVDGRDAYQMEAHMHWSPIKYAYWLNDYSQYLNQLPDGRRVTAPPVNISPALLSIDLTQPDTWSDSERLAVRRLFQEIQLLERDSYHGDTGAVFSHVLPFFGEQQYYELVGKYFQFAPGWEDYTAIVRGGRVTWIDENGDFIQSIEPEATGPGGTKPNVSARFYQYAEDHADANTYLRRASRITTLLIVNHVLAAVDAAIFSRLHNRRMQLRLGLLKDVEGRTLVAPQVSFLLNKRVH